MASTNNTKPKIIGALVLPSGVDEKPHLMTVVATRSGINAAALSGIIARPCVYHMVAVDSWTIPTDPTDPTDATLPHRHAPFRLKRMDVVLTVYATGARFSDALAPNPSCPHIKGCAIVTATLRRVADVQDDPGSSVSEWTRETLLDIVDDTVVRAIVDLLAVYFRGCKDPERKAADRQLANMALSNMSGWIASSIPCGCMQ
jgi:hypothetical protein